MVLLLVFLLIIILILCVYFIFKLVKWISKKKLRIKWAIALVGACMLTIVVNKVFFTKMKFIPSKVYPDLYLIKNPVEDRDSIHRFIKQKVLEEIDNELLGNKTKDTLIKTLPYRLRFYQYYSGTFLIPFGEAGTTHFIENKEDPGGFSSELIQHYNSYRYAEFDLHFCSNDSLHYLGVLNYYNGWDSIKKETLISQCLLNNSEVPSETALEAN